MSACRFSCSLRLKYGAAVCAAIALGLASRAFAGQLPAAVAIHAGDALWAAMVYYGLRWLDPGRERQTAALGALLFSFGIEFSQLIGWEWLASLRATTLGALVLGRGFMAVDLLRYTAGIAGAWMLDAACRTDGRELRGLRRRMDRAVAGSLAIYTLLLLYWMFIGFERPAPGSSGYRYNVIPFSTIKMYFAYFHAFNVKTWVINVVGNVAVFVPYGLLLPVWVRRLRSFVRFALIFVLVLLFVELSQMLLQVGSFDVDDILLNTLGASLGFVVGRRLRHRMNINRD